MEIILTLDQRLFFFLNHFFHSTTLDTLMLLVSGVGTGGIIWFALGFLIFMREEKQDHWFLVQGGILGVMGWFIGELFLKNTIGRIRPSELADTIVVGTVPTSFSFPSSHTVFAVAFALLLLQKEQKLRYYIIVLASLIVLSRMYLGYHYPTDVLGGALIGVVLYYFSIVFTSFCKIVWSGRVKPRKS